MRAALSLAALLLMLLWYGMGATAVAGNTSTAAANGEIAVEHYRADRLAQLHAQDASAALAQTILDKGLLAVIVAIAGFMISKGLDRYQALLATDTSIESERFRHLDEAWRLIHQCEHLKHEARALIAAGTRSQNSKALLSELRADFEEKAAIARRTIDEKVHWLGPISRGELTLYQELTMYHNMLTRLFYAYLEADAATVVRLEHELQRRKQYIADPRRIGAARWSYKFGLKSVSEGADRFA